MKAIFFSAITALMISTPGPAQKQDAFSQILLRGGINPADLTFKPKSYWARFPDLTRIPHLPRLFTDLYADPLRTHEVLEVMAKSVEKYLDPKFQAKKPQGIYQVAYYCGFEKIAGGFRSYTSNPPPVPTGKEPLVAAVAGLYARAGRVFCHKVMNKRADWPRRDKAIRVQVRDWPRPVRAALARAVTGLGEAWWWSQRARRRVKGTDLLKAWSIRDLSETQFDGMDYYGVADDIVAALDQTSLWYGAMKAAESTEILFAELRKSMAEAKDWDTKKISAQIWTPCGRIVIKGTGVDHHNWSDALLLVDLGGNDHWQGPVGATARVDLPVGVALDLSGNDVYENNDPALPAQGAGIFGVGILVDGAGDDRYSSRYLAQGTGQIGAGILADLGGNDIYQAEIMAQGAGIFGVGLLLDREGRDSYILRGGDGQGYGGVGGVGTLVDRRGDDSYFAEPKSCNFHRPDYHGENKFNYSYAQGVGVGRRGDLSDGHAWAGGMGTILDLAGDDRYEAGGWAQASSYWFGMGFLFDQAGNDTYLASHWSLGCGAHFAIAAMFDEGGNDRYLASGTNRNNLAFAHDYTQAIFVDRSGDDIYAGGSDSLGFAIRMSHALFLDLAGNDRYSLKQGGRGFGMTDAPKGESKPGLDFSYEIYSRQVGLFLDGGGKDTYTILDKKSGKPLGNAGVFDGYLRLHPIKSTRHRGLFLDLTEPLGPIPWLTPKFK